MRESTKQKMLNRRVPGEVTKASPSAPKDADVKHGKINIFKRMDTVAVTVGNIVSSC